MSDVVPKKIIERVKWFTDHAPVFTTNAAGIGLSAQDATAFTAKAAALQTAFAAQGEAQALAEAATKNLRDALDAADAVASLLLKKIRTQAEVVGGEGVYALAQIPAPKTPSNRPAPGEPTDLRVALTKNGVLDMTWKCKTFGASGTVYQIWRRTTPTGAFDFLGNSGQRSFVDATVPAGATCLTYQIRALRSTAGGPFGEFNVNLCPSGSGTQTATATPAPKLAA